MQDKNIAALLEACDHAAKSYHHPACKCKGERSAWPERYCTCHVQKCRAAVEAFRNRPASKIVNLNDPVFDLIEDSLTPEIE